MSEFGKGLCYCLGLFLAHAERLEYDLETYKKLQEKEPTLFNEKEACAMWFNGASDHLYEMEIDSVSKDLKKRLSIFQAKALNWGHGFMIKPTVENSRWAIQEAKDLLRLIDAERGIETEKGDYE